LEFPFAQEVETGDALEIDFWAGDVRNLTSGFAYCVPPLPRRLIPSLRGAKAAAGGRIARGRRGSSAGHRRCRSGLH
jgi:hypothetical protein